MADIYRAMNTPQPAAQQPQAPQPAAPPSTQRIVTVPDDVKKAVAREAKNERDRQRRKEKRAADAKAAEKKAAAPKRKKKKTVRVHALTNAAVAPTKKAKRRGRPPGAKNKPKLGLAVALVPAPGVLPRRRAKAASLVDLLAQINSAVLLLNAMPEHARRVVLDAVK